MNVITKTTSTAVLAALCPSAILAPTTPCSGAEPRDTQPVLPFSIEVKPSPMEKPFPMKVAGGMDFPCSPVKIEGDFWVFYRNGGSSHASRYRGPDIENVQELPSAAVRMPACAGKAYFLGGMWYDEADKKLYAPMHCEYFRGGHNRKIHLATSVDKGETWRYEGPIMTVDEDDQWGLTPTGVEKYPEAMWHRSSGFSYNGGDGDFYLCADEKKEYVYLYTSHYGSSYRHQVIRCAIKDKLAPGKWRIFRDGHWNEPALGGNGSYVNVYYSIYNTYLKKYIGFALGSGLAVCTDLSKQDWSPSFKIGAAWGMKHSDWAFTVVNEEKNDPHVGDRVLYLYTYYMGKFGQRYRITLGPGETRANEGYSFGWTGEYGARVGMDPELSRMYSVGPWLDSGDPIERRRTIVARGEQSAVVSANPATTNTKFSLSFQSDAIFWRCLKGPDFGKADVFVDGVLRKTVDCYASVLTENQRPPFGFIQTGLDPAMKHTIEVAARGEKGPLSAGTKIWHLNFEYAVDIHRATDGISGYMGRHQWYYQQRNGTVFTNMTFGWAPEKRPYWFGEKCSIQKNGLVSEQNEAVLKWVAPHDGTVSIEGGRRCLILQNAKCLWPADGERRDDSAPLTTKVVSGDAISFVLEKAVDGSRKECPLDQVVTYLVDDAKSPGKDRPSPRAGQP